MTVAELIAQLQQLPQDAKVWHLWDGELRTEVNYVWLARDGSVGTADFDQVLYSKESRPADAPDIPYWRTPDDPRPYEERP